MILYPPVYHLKSTNAVMDSVGLCAFCKQDVSPSIVGNTLTISDWTIHEKCLYFSSGLAQSEDADSASSVSGTSGDSLCGFSMKDILRELRRGLSIKCCGCRKPGGYVGCSVKHCQKAGHFPCLHKLGFCFQYGEHFAAFCNKHRPTQPRLERVQEECCICLSAMSAQEDHIYCPCCYTTFHRSCIQKQALSAGLHHFRCPVCKNKEEYITEMIRMGIAIPDRDASWEVGVDYAVEEYKYCHVETCLCPHGRSHYTQIGKYRMRKCFTCGQWRGHVECLRGDCTPVCDDCWAATPLTSVNDIKWSHTSEDRHWSSTNKRRVSLSRILSRQPSVVLNRICVRDCHGYH